MSNRIFDSTIRAVAVLGVSVACFASTSGCAIRSNPAEATPVAIAARRDGNALRPCCEREPINDLYAAPFRLPSAR